MNIATIGIGGVGGYLGAKLANLNRDDINTYFIARGAHLKAIQENGLTLIHRSESMTVRPALATDNTESLPQMDYIIYCTKSYDIANGIKTIKPIMGLNTIIIPFMNGVDAYETLREAFSEKNVCMGCTYIASSIKEYGVIEEITDTNSYYFGDGKADTPALKWLEQTAHEAGIQMKYCEDIESRVWHKFEFISTSATITTAYDITGGELLDSPEYTQTLIQLCGEFDSVAKAKGTLTGESTAKKHFETLRRLPREFTTSMQRDFRAGKTCEWRSLTSYIIEQGKMLNIPTPTYEKLLSMIKPQ